MNGIRIATSAITKTIYAGKINKKGDCFLTGKVDVTSDVLKSIIDYVGVNETYIVNINGCPTYEIFINKIGEEDENRN